MNNIEAVFANAARALGGIASQAAHIAHARRAMYDAYIAEGFSEAQALHLCERLTFD